MKRTYKAIKVMHKMARSVIRLGGVGFLLCSLAWLIFKVSVFEIAAGLCMVLCAFAALFYTIEYLFYDMFDKELRNMGP